MMVKELLRQEEYEQEDSDEVYNLCILLYRDNLYILFIYIIIYYDGQGVTQTRRIR